MQLLHDADGKFDAVILDHVLPGMDGIEATRQIHIAYPSVFIVMLTGKGLDAGLEALRAGAYRYIPKSRHNEEIAFLLKHIGEIRRMEQHLLDEQRLTKAARAIAEHAISSSRSDLLNDIAEGASQLLVTPICIIWELDLTDEKFKVAAHYGPVDADYRQSVSIDGREKVTQDFLETREPLVLADIQSPNRYQHKEEAAARGWKSLMSVPLAAQERVFAILDIISCEPRVFAPWEKQSFASFAAQAALAIRQVELLHHFREIGQLALSRDFKTLADYVAQAVGELTGTAASLWMIEKADDGGAVLHIKAGHGLRQEYMDTASLSLDPTLSVVAAGIAQKKPISKRDIFDDSILPPFHYKEEAILRGWKSFLSVPVLGPAGRPLGALSIYGSKAHEFSRSEEELLTSFATQTAIAFEQLLNRERLESLTKLGEAISDKTIVGMKSVLEEAAAVVCPLMGADHIAIYPYDPDRELFYDLDKVVFYPLGPSRMPKDKPRKRGLATKVRELGELVVTDTEAGESGVQGFADLQADGIDTQNILELISRAHFLKQHGIRAFMGLSLRASWTETSPSRPSEEVGVLYINYRAPHEFTEEELNLVRIFGHQLANAIHTARLIEKERRLNQQANSLRDVAEAIASPDMKPTQVAEKILDELQGVIAYKTATLQLIRKDGDTRKLIAARDFNEKKANLDDPQLLRPLSKDNLIREVVASKAPYILSDTHQWEGWGNNPNTAHVRSWACVPLVHGEKVVGLLTLDHDTPGFYQPAMTDILAAFGSQAAVAIRNQQLWGELQRRANGHKALNEVGMALVGAQSEEKILEIAVRAAVETLKCVHCSGFRVRGNEIVVVASIGNRASDYPLDRAFGLGEGVAGWVALKGDSRLVLDTRRDEHFKPEWSHPDPLALAVAPILLDGQVYGVFSAEDDKVSAFDEGDLRLLETLASQASQAIKNVRRTEQLKRLSEVTSTMTEMTGEKAGLKQTLDDILRSIDPILSVKASACITLYDAKSGEFGESFTYGPMAERLRTYPPRPDGTGAWVVHNKKPIFADDAAAETTDHPQMRSDFRKEVQSYAVLPLLVGDEALGTLYLDLGQRYIFTPETKELLQLFARQAAIAIENAKLYEHRTQDIAALQKVNAAITTANPTEILELILQQLQQVVASDSASIQLLHAGSLKIEACRGFERPQSILGKLFPLDRKYPNFDVIESEKPIVVEDTARDYPHMIDELGRPRFWLGVPLLQKNDVIGMIALDRMGNRPFTEWERSLARTFADQAVIAIENAKLYEQQKAVSEVGARLTSDLRLSETAILDLLHEQASRVMDTKNMYIALYDESTDTVRFPLAYLDERQVDTSVEKGWQPRSGGHGRTEWIIRERRPLLDKTLAESKAWYDESDREEYIGQPFSSWVGVPMLVEDRVLGVIATYHSDRENVYSEDDVQVLSMMAGYAAIALDNARLVQELDGRVNELGKLRELSEELSVGAWLDSEQ
ncbi:MAG: anaerobic nitric oxide reductase transcription regulator [Chloroflexi bacterium ADurb.Bin360]|nr:MAG: anaerobic nitric oxide reductase transcription regulator [Chloroflexi bacterium ADurb.Bin360]